MKLHIMKKGLYSSLFFTVVMSSAFANHAERMESAAAAWPGNFYVGGFGGGGSSDHFNVSQYGTAFYTEAAGGPLAVNAFGHTNSRSSWLAGAQVGYKAQDILIDQPWTLGPAIELEGFFMGDRTFTGNLTNNTTRLPAHEFSVSYPTERSVFLTNAVLNLNNRCLRFHPYVGAGFGGAIVEISGANAAQIAPPELGVNHYNANTSDTAPTFAGQVKAGMSYDINNYVSLFAEYRWLYLSTTHFAFGSTVYPGHVATSNWQVKLGSQHYNLGTAGIRFNL